MKGDSLGEKTNSLFEQLKITMNATEISKKLNVSPGTVLRWIENNNVPYNYFADISRVLNKTVDYKALSFTEKDQFFTPEDTAKKCYDIFIERTRVNENDYIFIEPGAGKGNFLKVFPESSRIGIDIEPMEPEIIQGDYLEWFPDSSESKKFIAFGNPPFGLRGHTALKFINHSAGFCDYVCFILPQLFGSEGRGSPGKRIKDMVLIFSQKIDNYFYYPDGKQVNVNCVFQIWKHKKLLPTDSEENTDRSKSETIHTKVVSLSDGGKPSNTRNKIMIGKCDFYLPSTCFGKEKMKIYNSFEDLPHRRGYGVLFDSSDKHEKISNARGVDWGEKSFLSTNGAYNLNKNIIVENI
jgi:transcriptional regulator with XRE-family HTH domain